MYPNNFGNPYGYRFPRPNVPNQPDMNDPNVLNNPALFQYIQQMNVPSPMPGFVPWNAPQEGYGFAGVTPQNTPGGHFGSDARVNFDLNSLDGDEELVFQERPIGRNASRKSSLGGSPGKGKGKLDESLDDISGQLRGLVSLTEKKLEYGDRKLKAKESKIKLAELRVLTTDYNYLDEPERSIMEQAKQEIHAKYGYS